MSLAEKRADVQCYCPQESEVSAFPSFVLLNGAPEGFR